MARLNRDAPFDVVGGLPGAAYSQNGHLFNNAGQEVETYRVDEGTDQARTLARRVTASNPNLTVADEVEFAEAQDPVIAPSALHWRQLKVLTDAYGHVWKDRKTALEFLENREQGVAEPKPQFEEEVSE
jgi:hypothetical protein